MIASVRTFEAVTTLLLTLSDLWMRLYSEMTELWAKVSEKAQQLLATISLKEAEMKINVRRLSSIAQTT